MNTLTKAGQVQPRIPAEILSAIKNSYSSATRVLLVENSQYLGYAQVSTTESIYLHGSYTAAAIAAAHPVTKHWMSKEELLRP